MASARRFAALLGFAAAVYALAVRPRLLRWGATDEELREPFPGAELIPGGRRGATMAVTIDAPPARVWPWLLQMGCDRAGWYSWDRLDNSGVPSAEDIHPLKALPEGRTRLVVSGYGAARPRALQTLAEWIFWEPAHWVMQTRQFENLKRRAES
jgi:hypothetical protein